MIEKVVKQFLVGRVNLRRKRLTNILQEGTYKIMFQIDEENNESSSNIHLITKQSSTHREDEHDVKN